MCTIQKLCKALGLKLQQPTHEKLTKLSEC